MDKLELIALFGGTFDPVHNGHLETVISLKKQLEIDQVRWVLSAQPPHKDHVGASVQQRLEMLDIALADEEGMVSDDIEIKRQGPSYTVLTLEELRQKSPQSSLLLIIGADSMQTFHTWRRYQDILELANIVVMRRPGYSIEPSAELKPYMISDQQLLRTQQAGNILLYETPEVPISATKIRDLRQDQQTIHGLVPDTIEQYILDNNLYIK